MKLLTAVYERKDGSIYGDSTRIDDATYQDRTKIDAALARMDDKPKNKGHTRIKSSTLDTAKREERVSIGDDVIEPHDPVPKQGVQAEGAIGNQVEIVVPEADTGPVSLDDTVMPTEQFEGAPVIIGRIVPNEDDDPEPFGKDVGLERLGDEQNVDPEPFGEDDPDYGRYKKKKR